MVAGTVRGGMRMAVNELLVKNEREADRFSAGIMIVSLGVLVLVYLLELFGIFKS